MRKNLYEAHKLYYEGVALLSDPKKNNKGVKKIEKAYKLGSPLALYQLGRVIDRSDLKDYTRNPEKSKELLIKAKPILEETAESSGIDAPLANHYLASYYLEGLADHEQDTEQGIIYEMKSSELGLVEATEYLASYYLDDEHKDPDKATFYCELATHQKAELSQNSIQLDEEEKSKDIEAVVAVSNNEEKVPAEIDEQIIIEEKLEQKLQEVEAELDSDSYKMAEKRSRTLTEENLISSIKAGDSQDLVEDIVHDEKTIIIDTDTVQNTVEEELKVEEPEAEEPKIEEAKVEEPEYVASPITIEKEEGPIVIAEEGNEPDFDLSKLLPLTEEEEEIEAKIKANNVEEQDIYIASTVDLPDLVGTPLPGDLFLARQRINYVDPILTEEELSPTHIATQMILKALRLLEEREEEPHKALSLLGEASKTYPKTANNILGELYYQGDLLEKDLMSSIHFFNKAEKEDSIYAAYMLGLIYYTADDTSVQDKDLGVRFIRKAASMGYGPALDKMGQIHHNGEISKISYQAAYRFYELAVARGHKSSYLAMADIDERRGDNALAEAHRSSAL